MIRIWTPAGGDEPPERPFLRGVAEHVGGGERIAFRGTSELLDFLESILERHAQEVDR